MLAYNYDSNQGITPVPIPAQIDCDIIFIAKYSITGISVFESHQSKR